MSQQDELPLGDEPVPARKTTVGPDCAVSPGSALPWAIPPSEIGKHKRDIQRQAISFWKSPNVFAGESRYERWRLCVHMVAESWMRLGPQRDEIDNGSVIYL